jgi:tetratricopeptide (TPR) repeat protein
MEIEASSIEELGWCAYHARELDRWAELAERAARHPGAGSASRVLLGRLRNAKGDLAGAIEMLEPVASQGDAVVAARASSYLGTALVQSDRLEEAADVLERAAATCRAAGLLRPMFNAAFFSGIAHASLGDLGVALDIALQIQVDVDRFDNEAYRPRAHNLLSWLWRELGDNPRAVDHAQQALETSQLRDGHIEAEPAAHARLQLAESALVRGDEAEAERWLTELREHETDSVAFGWRIDLRRLDLQARLDPADAEELLERSTERGSAKYRALALAHLGRRDEANALAATTGSDLLVAHVAPAQVAAAAADRLVLRLPPALRDDFMRRGACRVHPVP